MKDIIIETINFIFDTIITLLVVSNSIERIMTGNFNIMYTICISILVIFYIIEAILLIKEWIKH